MNNDSDLGIVPIKAQKSDDSDLGIKPIVSEPGFLEQAGRATVNALPEIGGVVGGVLGTPADVIAGPMGNMAGAGIGGYLGSSAKNLINSYIDPKQAPQSIQEAVTQPIKEGAKQAAFQGGSEIATKAISAAASYAVPKALSLFGGVNEKVIGEYAANSERINAAPSLETLKNISDNYVGKLAEDVEGKKLNVQQAQEAFNALKTELSNKYQTMGYDARDALSSAKDTLKDAHTSTIQNTSENIVSTIQKLREEVQAGSEKSYGILESENVSLPVAPIKRQLTQLMNELKIAGKSPVGGDATTALKQLGDIRETLNQFPKELPGTEVKKLVQQLQKSTSYGQNAAEFSQTGDAAIKQVSRSVNENLKNLSPAYREQMENVAKDTGLLNKVSPFADKSTGAGMLSRIETPGQIGNKEALQELGSKYGNNFIKSVNPESLPEYGLLQKAESNVSNLRPDVVKQKIAGQLSASPESAQLQSAQQGLEASKTALAPLKPLAPNISGQTQAQEKLMQLAKGKNIDLHEMFTHLGKMTNTDFVQAMHDQNVLAAFNKGAVNGSRRTVLGSVLGAMFGSFHGGVMGGVAGSGIGGQIGFASDYYGPTVTKGILNGVIKVSKSKPAQVVKTITGLDLPADIKNKMINAFANMGLQENTGGQNQ